MFEKNQLNKEPMLTWEHSNYHYNETEGDKVV